MTLLLLLHGFTGSSESFSQVLRGLRPAFEVIAPALLGHAGSAEDGRVTTFQGEVDRLAALVPDGQNAHLAGYSLGARLGLALLTRYPARFTRATLVSAHPGLRDEQERRDRRASDEKWCALLETEGLPAFVTTWQSQPLFASQSRLSQRLLAAQARERLSHSPLGLARSLRVTGLSEMPDLRPELAKVSARVTLLSGGLDTKFSMLAAQLHERLPGSRLQTAANRGHNLLLEDPDLVTEAISEGIPP